MSLAIVKKDQNYHYLHAIFFLSLKMSNYLDSMPVNDMEKYSSYILNMWRKKFLKHDNCRKTFMRCLFLAARIVINVSPTLRYDFFVIV